MFILEGPDGSGKSTLGHLLRRTTQLEIIHAGGPPLSVSEVFQRAQNHSKLYGKGILDRCVPISEFVYGPIRSEEPLVSNDILFGMIDELVRQGWILIYCRPSDTTIIEYAETKLEDSARDKAHKPEDHTRKVRERIQTIINRYDQVIEVCKQKGMLVLVYNRDGILLEDDNGQTNEDIPTSD